MIQIAIAAIVIIAFMAGTEHYSNKFKRARARRKARNSRRWRLALEDY